MINGTEAALPQGWEDFHTVPEAAALLDVDQSTLRRWIKQRKIPKCKTPKGVRLNPADVERLAEWRDDVDDDGPPELTERAQTSAVLAEALTFVRLLVAQQESLVKAIVTPMKEANENTQRIIQQMATRCAGLEAKHDEMICAREELLSLAQERQLAAQLAEEESKRKTQAWDLVMQHGPDVLRGLATGKHPKAAAAVAIMETLTEDQLELLLHSEFLSPEQLDHLRKIVPQKKQETKP